jgi:chemotaxis protein methyltransferase CheR
MNDIEYLVLKKRIMQLIDLDIDAYKSQQMRRRLEGYVARQSPDGPTKYCRLLEDSADRRRELLDFLAINVTEFFRDGNQFDYLKANVLPRLLRESRSLKIWSAACSSGQEAYSMAMMLNEMSPNIRHHILATDIDNEALNTAINGGPYNQMKNVPSDQLEKYFVRTEGGYMVNAKTRGRVDFGKCNLVADNFESGFDLVLCRNVIIYFKDQTRDLLFRKFADAIRPGGVLFLGGSEVMLAPPSMGFSFLHPSFYEKTPVGGAVLVAGRKD